MNKTYNNNIEYLEKLYPKLALLIKNTNIDLKLIKCKDGNYTYKTTNGNISFHINSLYSPIKEALRLISFNYNSNIKEFIVFGFGLGYHILALFNKININQKIIIFDPNIELVKSALKINDFTKLISDSRVKLFIDDDINYIGNEFVKSIDNLDNKKLILHNTSIKYISDDLKEFRFLLENLKIKLNSIEENRELLQENYIKNKNILTQNASEFFGKYKDKRIIVVSAGPSLDKNISVLKKDRSNSVIVSVGRALKSLVNNGVLPDFFVITDPQKITRRQLKGLENINVKGIFLSTTGNDAVISYNGPKYVLFADLIYMDNEDEKNIIDTGGSVSTAALEFAIRLGGNPIIVIGQDLAYDDEKHHANDSLYGPKDLGVDSIPKGALVEEKGWHGDVVISTLVFKSYKLWIENRIRKESSVRFVNATEGGVYLEGMEHLKLEEVISDNN